MSDDALSMRQIGDRLRSAREALGWSTRVVARELARKGIPVSHATIANYESGRTVPGMRTIHILSIFYSKPIDWFLGSGPVLTGVRYRCLKAVKVSEKKAFEAEAAGWLQAYIELENVLGLPLKAVLHFRPELQTGAKLAEAVRGVLDLGPMQPIASVVDVLQRFGVRVIQIWSEARIDALAANFGNMPVVVLNGNLSNDRIRFDASHELWHILAGECDQDVDLDDKSPDGPAHEFASHLLLSDIALREAFQGNSMVRLVQFKERYGISLAAMIYRARKADLISDSLYQRLWKEFTRLGWRKQEPGYVPPDRPTRFEEMMDTAVKDRQLVSFADIARFAGVTDAAVRQRWVTAMGGGSFPEQSGSETQPDRIGWPGNRGDK